MAAIFDNIFKLTLLYEICFILINIWLKFVAKGQIGNNPELVQIMAWCWAGDKPSSEPMMTQFANAYMCHLASLS